MNQIHQHLPRLAQPHKEARREALTAILREEGLPFTVQTEPVTEASPRPAQNILLLPEAEGPWPLFCAHYDAFPGSPGANDNAAALCILIELAKTLRQRGVPAAFAFLDGEEEGHTGAKLLEKQRQWECSLVVNLDVCGYGDTLAVYSKGNPRAAGAFCEKARLEAHHGKLVKFLPESDDKCFAARRQPVLSVAVMPRWDTQYLESLARMGSGVFGRPPEFEMILGQMEVVTTMHGAFRDDIKWIQPEAMQQVYSYLLDAVTAPPPKANRFRFF